MNIKNLIGASVLVLSMVAHSATETVDGILWEYIVSNNVAIVRDEIGGSNPAIHFATAGDIVVPTELGGYPVKKIGDYAFVRCQNLTSVKLNSDIESIGVYAFSECASLTNLAGYTSTKITEVSEGCFATCVKLSIIKLPERITKIGADAFSYCTSLRQCNTGNYLIEICDRAFADTALDFFRFRPSVKTVGAGVFSTPKQPGVDCLLCNVVFEGAVPTPSANLRWFMSNCRGTVWIPSKYETQYKNLFYSSSATYRYTDENDIDAWASGVEGFAAKYGTDKVSYMKLKSGKVDANGCELTLHDEYVMGTNPMDKNSTLAMGIQIVDGKPVLSWTPSINGDATDGSSKRTGKRTYKVYGAKNLEDGFFANPIKEGSEHQYRFFKVGVELADVPQFYWY